MIEAILIYLYITIGKLANSFLVVGIFGGGILAWLWVVFDGEVSEAFLKWSKRALAIFVIGGVISVFYPSKEDLVMIVGGAAALNIAQTEEAAKLPENVLGAMNRFLESVEAEDE